jgi:ATP-dependent helicase HrpB
MWSKATNEKMAEHRTPEILEVDLASLVLDMAQWGIVNISQLTWLTPPPKSSLAHANETLNQLNALENGRITEHGKKIHALPCHPRIAHMLVMAKESNMLPLAVDIASLLEERDPLTKEAGIDINVRIEALRRYRSEYGQGKKFGKIEKVAKSYRKLFRIEPDNGEVDPYETGVLLAHCYPERIAFARPGNNSQFQLANGKYASFSHKDDLAHESWLSIAHVDGRDGIGKIFLASPLDPKDLAPLVKEQEVITWDTEDGELRASKDLRIGSIVLRSKPLPKPDDKHLTKAISEAIKREGQSLLSFDEEVIQWQNRVLSLRKWRPQEGWPDVSTPTLLMTNMEWLGKYLTNIEDPADLKKIDLLKIVSEQLDDEKKKILDVLAPSTIVLGNKKSKVHYLSDGQSPIVKSESNQTLSENRLFVNEGKIELLIQ